MDIYSESFRIYNFSNLFIEWVKLFYNNIVSCVTVNGHLSDWFSIHRGCRQGDSLSPYSFIICAEILAVLIKTNPSISGIKVEDTEFLVSQYADDTSLILDGPELSLKTTLKVLKFYARISGLYMNTEKARTVWFGSSKGSDIKYCIDENLNWEKGTFIILGVKFTTNLSEMTRLNYKS